MKCRKEITQTSAEHKLACALRSRKLKFKKTNLSRGMKLISGFRIFNWPLKSMVIFI